MNDRETELISKVIEGCINGDRQSQQVLYRMFYGKMLGVCLRYSRDKNSAFDILQEGFLKVFLNIKTYSGNGSFEGWVRKIMVNTILDGIRKSKHSVVSFNSEYVEANAEEEALTVDADEEDDKKYLNISSNKIMEAVQQLSPAYRTVFNMYVVDGFSHKEIAEQLGISEGTSKSNLSKAKMNLKTILTNQLQVKEQIKQ